MDAAGIVQAVVIGVTALIDLVTVATSSPPVVPPDPPAECRPVESREAPLPPDCANPERPGVTETTSPR